MLYTNGRFVSKTAAALLLVGLVACQHPPPASRVPIAVEVVRMSRGDSTSMTQSTGDIHAAVESALSFRISDKVVERKVDVGAVVKAGDLLARLDPQEQKADLAVTEASVRAAKAAFDHAELELGRDRTLLAHDAIAQAALDASIRERDAAKSTLEAAEASQAMARDALSFTELRAGSAGVITSRTVESGQVVQSGQPVYGLADSGARDAVFEVDEATAARVRSDTKIALSLVDAPDVKAEGKVREIAPLVDVANGSVRIKVRIENAPAGMGLGMPIVGRLALRAAETFTVPASAIAIDAAGRPSVFVVDPKTNAVAIRAVAVTTYESGAIVIRDGLTDGEIVVARGSSLLRPGQIIRFADGNKS